MDYGLQQYHHNNAIAFTPHTEGHEVQKDKCKGWGSSNGG